MEEARRLTSASAPSRSLSGQFVERFTHAWAQRDPELLGALFEPDASVRQPPVRHAFRGDEIPAYFREVFQLLPDIHLEPIAWAARDDVVIIEWIITASVGGSPLSWCGVDRFRLRGGRVFDEAVYFDSLPLWERLDPTMNRSGLINFRGAAGGLPDGST